MTPVRESSPGEDEGRSPRVSVGLPVRNGERYLAEAVESILDQTFEDLELVICDNGSTDGTEEICRDVARRDPRVRYHRNERDLGASANFNRTFELARGEYFRWHSDDDLLAPTFLERCVEVLDADPGVVLAHTRTVVIDEEGRPVDDFAYPPGYARSDDPVRRFVDVVRADRWCFDVFGLVRADAFARTRMLDHYVASDRILRAELALLGRYHVLDEPLFLNRDHPERSVRKHPAHHLRGEWFDPALAGKRLLPHWRILREYWRCVGRHDLRAGERIRARASLARWVARHGNWARLVADVVIAAAPGLWEVIFHRSRAGDEWLEGRPA